MFKWMIMSSMSLIILFKHPLIMILSIIISSSLSSFLMFFMTSNQWVNYILVLTFLGGMMILFMYMASLTPNEEFMSKNKLFMWMLILSIMMIFGSKEESNYLISMNLIYSSFWMSILFMISVISTILVYIMMIVYEPFNPLKAKN